MYVPLLLKPGINKEETSYGAEGGFIDGDKVRFWQGFPQVIYGWEDIGSGATVSGICRGLYAYEDLQGGVYVAVGTSSKWYQWLGSKFYDVTPFRRTATLSNPFTTVAGSPVVTVSDIAHGASTGDTLQIPTAVTVGGLTLQGDYEVTFVDPVTLTITTGDGSTATLGTSGGGADVVVNYYIAVGLTGGSAGTGYGTTGYGTGGYGASKHTTTRTFRTARTWNFDSFGQDVVGNYSGGPIYHQSSATTTGNRATVITQAPQVAELILVTRPDRHVVAYGADDGTGKQDPMLVRWSVQGDYTNWQSLPTNDAGSQRLQGGSRIVGALQGRQEVYIWTDTSLIAQTYDGYPFTFGFTELATGCGLISSKAAVVHEGVAYWMSNDTFYMYDGMVRPMPCKIRRFVFEGMNFAQRAKFHAGLCKPFNEIWFFYCSQGSSEIDRYAAVSLYDFTWHVGLMTRTAYVDGKGLLGPIATDDTGYLYRHESGTTANGAPLANYVRTALMDYGEGDKFIFLDKIVPDFVFANPTDSVTIQFNTYNYPSQQLSSRGPYAVTPTTRKISMRARARATDWTIASNAWWRLGKIRINYQPDGSR